MALTNDDLLSISQLLDVKLKAEIQPIKNEIQTLRNEIRSVKTELQGEIQAVKTELQGEIQAVKAELQGEIQAVKAELQAEIHQIKLFQENIMMPRLNTIESCYTSTYDRYKDSVEEHESMKQDIDILKKVVTDHSEKLQRIS